MTTHARWLLTGVAWLVAIPIALAQSTVTTYQGRLESGGASATGSHNFVFRLCSSAGPGGVLQTFPPAGTVAVTVTNGLFTQELTFDTAHFNGAERWLEIEVDGTALSPRQHLTYAPYASFALNADKLDGVDSAAFLQSIPVPLTLSGTNPGLHIIRGDNASTADGSVGVYGTSTAASGVTYGRRFENASANGYGVFGLATSTSGTTWGVWGQNSSTIGSGVCGYAASPSGSVSGVYGRSDSTTGRGVFGEATATSGTTYGAYARSASTGGYGVYGYATASTGGGRGVNGVSESTSGLGVVGYATSATGTTYGVQGLSASTSGRGVFGHASATSGTTYGGRFESDSPIGRGVYGYASASGANDTPYGVRGQCSTTTLGYGVYALGDMGASGTKPFRIDHLDDPENKYLLHYAAESPEVINFYRGTVALDNAGEAVVELPPYFAKINKTPSYQLTAVGAPMPNLHVAEEISEAALNGGASAGAGVVAPACTFRIAGGAPRAKVSWEVKAVRNDSWVRSRAVPARTLQDGRSIETRAIPVEVEKQDAERGKYQHPEHYGQPPEKGMDHHPDH